MKSRISERIRDRLIRHQEERRRRNIPQPSFYSKMAQRKRLADRVRRLRGIGDEPIYEMETKLGQKTVANESGVHTADILQGPFDVLSKFDLGSLPDRFVVKPVVGSGSNGVFLLEKKGDRLVNLVSQTSYPLDLNALHSAGLSKFDGVPLIV
jgi:hypothetical protein